MLRGLLPVAGEAREGRRAKDRLSPDLAIAIRPLVLDTRTCLPAQGHAILQGCSRPHRVGPTPDFVYPTSERWPAARLVGAAIHGLELVGRRPHIRGRAALCPRQTFLEIAPVEAVRGDPRGRRLHHGVANLPSVARADGGAVLLAWHPAAPDARLRAGVPPLVVLEGSAVPAGEAGRLVCDRLAAIAPVEQALRVHLLPRLAAAFLPHHAGGIPCGQREDGESGQ
mmetsp:Transcript_74932/g.217498  ORF Transcript_74932/g.217498 Transcript_74932/m.217498 type:complete len:226 (+) Transcript_74932:514-1191(+)